VNSSDHFDEQIAFLDHFFNAVKDDSLLSHSADILSKMRQRLRLTLADLLVWGRPYLLDRRGLHWPYEESARIGAELERIYAEHSDTSTGRQAMLFLASLPVPNQWRWLARATDTLAEEPEIKDFLTTERRTVRAKLTEKPQSVFKLRHFVQILKAPRLPEEKGVLRIFSLPYLFLNRQLLQQIARHYVFYLEPPMGVVYRHTWWRIFTELSDPCIFGLGGEEDRHFVASQANTRVISLAHGDYLPDVTPVEQESAKDIDIVFNATFDDMERKRHVLMLELLQDQRLVTKNALFIGRGEQGLVEEFKKTVNRLGLTKRVIVLANIRRQDIPRQLARCRLGVHLSLYENSCRCIYEYFRADIPCILSQATAGMDTNIFNQQTGKICQDDLLAEVIAQTLSRTSSYSPRTWYLKHSGSENSSQKLNDYLKNFFAENGYLWREDIIPLDSSGASRYMKKEHYRRFLPEFHRLLSWLQTSTTAPIRFTVDEM